MTTVNGRTRPPRIGLRLAKQLRQLSDVGGDAPRLFFAQQLRRRTPTGFVLEVDVGELLPCGVLHDEAGVALVERPRWAGSGDQGLVPRGLITLVRKSACVSWATIGREDRFARFDRVGRQISRFVQIAEGGRVGRLTDRPWRRFIGIINRKFRV